MAEYIAKSRSNYFRVDDVADFTAEMEEMELTVLRDKDGRVGVMVDQVDKGIWPFYDFEKDEEIDIVDAIAAHLVDGEVAVLMQSGARKHAFIGADAVAFNNQGERVTLSLQEIYDRARGAQLGENMTFAEE
jgi:hypothetical protein